MSLVEVMIAGSILAVILSTSAMLLGFGFERTGDARRSAAAERIAASHLELLLLENAAGGIPSQGRRRFDVEGQADPRGAFVSSWTLERDRPVPGASRLAVEVGWNVDRPRTQKLVTYLVRP